MMSLPPRYPPDDRLPADTFRLVLEQVRVAPDLDGKGSILFNRDAIAAILEAAMRAEERLIELEGPPRLDYGR